MPNTNLWFLRTPLVDINLTPSLIRTLEFSLDHSQCATAYCPCPDDSRGTWAKWAQRQISCASEKLNSNTILLSRQLSAFMYMGHILKATKYKTVAHFCSAWSVNSQMSELWLTSLIFPHQQNSTLHEQLL